MFCAYEYCPRPNLKIKIKINTKNKIYNYNITKINHISASTKVFGKLFVYTAGTTISLADLVYLFKIKKFQELNLNFSGKIQSFCEWIPTASNPIVFLAHPPSPM